MSFKNATDALIKATNKVFGETVTYTRASDSVATDLIGILTNQYIEIDGVASNKPTIRFRLDELEETPVEGDTIDRENGSSYEVQIVQTDDPKNEVLLILKRTV
jgi:hypothetical protein